MFHLLLFIIIAFFVLVFAFGASFIRLLLSPFIKPKGNSSANGSYSRQQQSNQAKNTGQQSSSNSSKKIITPEEGEYIDFEEIKDK